MFSQKPVFSNPTAAMALIVKYQIHGKGRSRCSCLVCQVVAYRSPPSGWGVCQPVSTPPCRIFQGKLATLPVGFGRHIPSSNPNRWVY